MEMKTGMTKNNANLPQWAIDQLGKLREIYNKLSKGDNSK